MPSDWKAGAGDRVKPRPVALNVTPVMFSEAGADLVEDDLEGVAVEQVDAVIGGVGASAPICASTLL